MQDEKTLSSLSIFNGQIIQVRKDTVLLQNGNTSTREIVSHPGGVAILPIDDQKRVTLVRQFRKPLESTLLEVPAGKLDGGEDPYTCAVRELKEETGFTAKTILPLGFAYLSPGFCDEKIHLFIAKDLEKGAMQLDEDEFLSLETYPLKELITWVEEGKILDAKSIILLLRAKELLGREEF